eukprot:tig00001206_g7496.t1
MPFVSLLHPVAARKEAPSNVIRSSLRSSQPAVARLFRQRAASFGFSSPRPAPARYVAARQFATSSASQPTPSAALTTAARTPGDEEQLARMMDAVLEAAKKYPKPEGKQFRYGTIGFRGHADDLEPVMFRLGIVAALRSKKSGGKVTGVMITASHNPACDNGAKLIDVSGEMLESSWESVATAICNAENDALPDTLRRVAAELNLDLLAPSTVFLARDNRTTGAHFLELVRAGVELTSAKAVSFEQLTTPQLHLIVQETNLNGGKIFNEDDYYSKLASAFKRLISLRPSASQDHWENSLVIDCANGVGGVKISRLAKEIADVLKVEVRNCGDGAMVNYEVGADYVNVNKRLPRGFDGAIDKGRRMASIDGDVDRVVFGHVDDDGKFHLLDGDKIMCLYTKFIIDQLRRLGCADEVSIGVVQTAYANGSSTKYITKHLNVPVNWSPTGVRHLHHRAVSFDIGLYFESNGHGTVLFQNSAIEKIKQAAAKQAGNSDAQHAFETLVGIHDLMNQAVGDAISDLLLVEAVLAHNGWSASDWDAIYKDMPSLLLKVKVADRYVLTTNEIETRAVNPPGTEDIIRVFAEAPTKEQAKALAYEVSGAVYDICAGIGPRPAPFPSTKDVAKMSLSELVVASGIVPPSGRPFNVEAANQNGMVSVMLAAGQGSRFKADTPKVIYPFLGRPMAEKPLSAVAEVGLDSIVVVGFASDLVTKTLGVDGHTYVLQQERLGTGHAVFLALQGLGAFEGDVLVLYADNPGVDAALIKQIITAHSANKARYGEKYSGLIVTGVLPDAGFYGRIVRGTGGTVIDIVERKVIEKMDDGEERTYADGSHFKKEQLRSIGEFNSGIVMVRAGDYLEALASISPTQTKEDPVAYEYYATDFVSQLVAAGKIVEGFQVPAESLWKVEGANTLEELDALESKIRSLSS